MWKIVYNFFVIPFLYLLFHLGKFFNEKIRRGVTGRHLLLEQLEMNVASLAHKQRIWFHASSLGEFEQAKPIIVAIKNKYPDVNIVTTFFSPSGFENSRNYKLSDIITYIPFDTSRNAESFLRIVKPTAAIILRYDIWPNMIWALSEKKIPSFIVNATMKEHSPRMMMLVRQFHRNLYNCFSHILTVSAHDLNSFRLFDADRPVYDAIGDTRFDQVMSRSIDAATKNILPKNIFEGKKILIIGQSWGEDELVVLPAILKIQKHEPSLLTIIVPHEPTIEHLESLEQILEGSSPCIRFSDLNTYRDERIILVDSIGILVALYKYAHVVYVGGSFKQGIHNVLEPAVFGLPVLFGPKHTNSQEAIALKNQGGGFAVNNQMELYRTLRMLLDDEHRRVRAGEISKRFVYDHCGATDRFLKYLEPFIKS